MSLSSVVFNLLPILYFVTVFFYLRNTPTAAVCTWTFWDTFRQITSGMVPAFAVFGFYRLWLAFVEMNPKAFY